MSLEPGKNIAPQLRLVRCIGRGAMGSVWIADHLGLGAQVAVKFLSSSLTEDPVSIERFRREARAAASIRSPHVVQTYDHGVANDGQHYIVMELLDGDSLERRVRTKGPVSTGELALIVGQTCKGLAKAHEQRIIHRDIKPANIFLVDIGDEREIFIKVLDFGVAKFTGEQTLEMTGEGKVVGTPAYMSPDQLFHGRQADSRWDLWSLGVCAYFAITGTRPFEGSTIGELCVAIKRGEFVRPSALRTGVPPDVDAWFIRALHADIDARFRTARDMAEALEAAVGVATIMASTPSTSGPFQRTSGSHSAIATYAGATMATLITGEVPTMRRARLLRRLAVGSALGAAALAAAAFIAFRSGEPAPATVSSASAASSPSAAPASPPVREAVVAPIAAPSSSESAAPASSSDATPSAAPADPKSPARPAAREPRAPGAPPTAPPTSPSDDRSERAGKQLGI